MTHSQQLTSPHWQKRRLQILERDKWHCTNCGNSEEQLEVHHLFYLSDWKLWEYPDDWLIALCHTCHEKEKDRDKVYMNLLNTFKTKGFLIGDLMALSCLTETNDYFARLLLKTLRQFQHK